jgi:hypothetical protein
MSLAARAAESHAISLRGAAILAGAALLAMGFLTPFAEFFVFPKLIVRGDIEQTVLNIRSNPALFLAGAFANLTTYVLDVIVAWALWVLLTPVNRSLSLLTAWFRLIYTAIALFGPLKLLTAYRLLDTSDSVAAVGSAKSYDQIELLLESSRYEWGIGLVLFGIHLILLGYLVYRSNFIPRTLGVLLVVAGMGYIVLNLGPYLYPTVDVGWLFITFLGEVIFIFWLLIRGWKISESAAGARHAA